MIIQALTACTPLYPIYRDSLAPYWNEWILLIWLSGLLLGELISPQDRSGLGAIKLVIIFLNLVIIDTRLLGPISFKLSDKQKIGQIWSVVWSPKYKKKHLS